MFYTALEVILSNGNEGKWVLIESNKTSTVCDDKINDVCFTIISSYNNGANLHVHDLSLINAYVSCVFQWMQFPASF